MELTAAERVLVHLHGFWNVSEPGREATQAGIADGARLLRSHVPRTLKALQDDGLADSRDTRLRGQRRKIRVYALTEAGVRQARQILGDIDRTTVEVDGRTTTLGEARKALGLDPGGRFLLFPADPDRPEKRYDRALAVAGDVPLLTLGAVEPERVPLWVNAANAVLVPSERESFGLAVLS